MLELTNFPIGTFIPSSSILLSSGVCVPRPFVECLPDGSSVIYSHDVLSYIFPNATSHKNIIPIPRVTRQERVAKFDCHDKGDRMVVDMA